MSLDLVIFDNDGVLVDSETLSNRNLQAHLKPLGIEMSYAQVRATYLGMSFADVIADLERRTGGPIPEDWYETLKARDAEVYARELRPVPGVRAAVERVQAAGLATCVASSGDYDRILFKLDLTGLLDLFEGRIFSASMVERGKPAPDLFLHAAREMGAAPGACAVIEDSPRGAQGAVAAGMRCLGYTGDPHGDHAGLEAAGAELFGDMKDLPALLGLD